MKLEDGIEYAVSVVKGDIDACRNVRLACQRFVNHIENKEWEWVFDPGPVNHFLQHQQSRGTVIDRDLVPTVLRQPPPAGQLNPFQP